MVLDEKKTEWNIIEHFINDAIFINYKVKSFQLDEAVKKHGILNCPSIERMKEENEELRQNIRNRAHDEKEKLEQHQCQ